MLKLIVKIAYSATIYIIHYGSRIFPFVDPEMKLPVVPFA